MKNYNKRNEKNINILYLPNVNNSVVMAFPIPVPPPVTIATFPANRPFRKTLILCKYVLKSNKEM